MSNSFSAQPQSSEVNSLDSVRPQPAKASLKVNDSQSAMTVIVKAGLIKACGSLKAAAIQMHIDGGQLTRELESGAFKFERLDHLTPEEKAVVIEGLHQEFGTVTSPQQYAARLFREIEQRLDALKQVLEHVA